MELRTFIFENNEMNLGNASEAYNKYPHVKTAFDAKLKEYQEAISRFVNMNPLSITNDEMKKVDMLADEIEEFRKDCFHLRTILVYKLEEMVHENIGLEQDLAAHTDFLRDEEVHRSLALHNEAIRLKEEGDITMAIEKAYYARESMTDLLIEAKKSWIDHHQKRAEDFKTKNR